MKPTLIEDWHKAWRWWSVQLNLLGSALLAWLLWFPDVAQQIWLALPDALKARLPHDVAYFVPLVILFAANLARILKQGRPPS